MPKYAKDQPDGFRNAIERIALVGAGGTIGSVIAAALLATGNYNLTVVSRRGTTADFPPDAAVQLVDYANEASIVDALRGQQLLIITMSPTAPRDTTMKLIHAAAKAGVQYILPNAFAGDINNIQLGNDTLLGPAAEACRAEIERLGMQWLAVACGFWYDYSLAGGESRFGFDFERMSVTLYDDGRTKISTSTLAQVGRAVARVANFKELPQDENDEEVTFSQFTNRPLYIKSFVVSQRDMFESVKRVTNTADGDWDVTCEPSEKRFVEGLAQVKAGDMSGFSKLLYARIMYPEEKADLSLFAQNDLLDLPEESLDACTKNAVDMVAALQRRPDRMAA